MIIDTLLHEVLINTEILCVKGGIRVTLHEVLINTEIYCVKGSTFQVLIIKVSNKLNLKSYLVYNITEWTLYEQVAVAAMDCQCVDVAKVNSYFQLQVPEIFHTYV